MVSKRAVIFSSIPSNYLALTESPQPLQDLKDVRVHWVMPSYSSKFDRGNYLDTMHFVHQNDRALCEGLAAVLVGGRDAAVPLLYTSEYEMEMVAAIGAALGIEAISPDRATLFRDKLVMKDAAVRGGLDVPVSRRVNSEGDIADLLRDFPRVVVKPVAGSGSVNTYFVDATTRTGDLAELTFDGKFEVEEYIDAPMLHIEAVIRDGDLLMHEVGRYFRPVALYRETGLFGTVYIRATDLRERAREYLGRLAKAFEVVDGVIHLEVFDHPRRGFVFCEVALRPGGAGIPQCIEQMYGVSLFEEHYRAQLGLPSLIKQDAFDRKGALTTGLMWRYNEVKGRVVSITPQSSLPPEVFFSRIEANTGQLVARTQFNGLPLGMFGVAAESEMGVMDAVQRLDAAFKVGIDPT